MIWVFVVAFPLLLGSPVIVRVETEDADHCQRVRKLLMSQLAEHRSNALVHPCLLSAPTVVLPTP